MRTPIRRPLVAGVVLALALTACGSGEDKVASKVSTVDLLSGVPARAAEAGSARFEISLDMPEGAEAVNVTADGVVDFANGSMQMEMKLADLAPGAPDVSVEMRVVDGVVYMNMADALAATGEANPFGDKPWMKLDPKDLGIDAGATQQQNPADLLEALRGIGDIDEVGRDTIDGVETTEYRGEIDLNKALAQLDDAQHLDAEDQARVRKELEKVLPSGRLPVRVWVDDGGLARRVAMQMEAGGERFAIEMDFFDYGVDVQIEAPPADQVGDMSGLLDPAAAAA